jgi:hypothetical protein
MGTPCIDELHIYPIFRNTPAYVDSFMAVGCPVRRNLTQVRGSKKIGIRLRLLTKKQINDGMALHGSAKQLVWRL